ncbi:MAG: YdcF family protein, partial [Parasporobacterium sp.]|nr:YdcF family protein [Parasporobacterium sp.]
MKKDSQRRRGHLIIKGIIIFLIAAVVIAAAVVFMINKGNFNYYIFNSGRPVINAEAEVEDEAVAVFEGTETEDGYTVFRFKAVGKGETPLCIRYVSDGIDFESEYKLKVNGIGLLSLEYSGIDGGGWTENSQWHILFTAALAVLLLTSILQLQSYVYKIKTDLYSYKTIQKGGIAVFLTGMTLIFAVIYLLVLPGIRNSGSYMLGVYFRTAFFLFIVAAIPFIAIFGIALTISNIRLITREGFRPVNVLGIIISAALMIFAAAALYVPIIVYRSINVYVSVGVSYLMEIIQYVFLALFGMFLSFMLSTMICGLTAAKRVPAFDADYIIILGCGIRKDGTLLPLIQGRVDRALWFRNKQLEATGKEAVLVPSGGKGSDEIISEGEAMKRYLMEKGIPEDMIRAETGSTTTLENMRFSKDIIDKEKKDAKIVYSTTNYHVFRSGILARQAGLNADGVGGRTKWYFWPNAFVR